MIVISRNMKMPSGCNKCDLVGTFVESTTFYCPFCINDTCWDEFEGIPEYRLEDCPLIEIKTPHGRLIDADRLLRDNADFADRDFIHPSSEVTLRELIDDAPTVIKEEWENDAAGSYNA